MSVMLRTPFLLENTGGSFRSAACVASAPAKMRKGTLVRITVTPISANMEDNDNFAGYPFHAAESSSTYRVTYTLGGATGAGTTSCPIQRASDKACKADIRLRCLLT